MHLENSLDAHLSGRIGRAGSLSGVQIQSVGHTRRVADPPAQEGIGA